MTNPRTRTPSDILTPTEAILAAAVVGDAADALKAEAAEQGQTRMREASVLALTRIGTKLRRAGAEDEA